MPELNEQTRRRINQVSDRIGVHRLATIDPGFDREQLEPGTIHFINVQKLGSDKRLTGADLADLGDLHQLGQGDPGSLLPGDRRGAPGHDPAASSPRRPRPRSSDSSSGTPSRA